MGDDTAQVLRGGDAEEDIGLEDSAGQIGGDLNAGGKSEAGKIRQVFAGFGELFGES